MNMTPTMELRHVARHINGKGLLHLAVQQRWVSDDGKTSEWRTIPFVTLEQEKKEQESP